MTRSYQTVQRRSTLLPLLCVFAVLLPGVALASDIKIGFVNIKRVLEESVQATSANERLEKEFAPKDRALMTQQKELRALEDQLVRDGAVMTEDQRFRLEADISGLRREVRRSQVEFQEEFNLRRNQELSKLQRQVRQVIQDLSKAEGYDLVVSDVVLYASPGIDITDAVLLRLDSGG